MKKRYIVAITGTTGVEIGLRLLEILLLHAEVHLIVSNASLPIIKEETGLDLTINPEKELKERIKSSFSVFIYKEDNLWAPVASGSFITNGMLIVPCSMKTLSAIANGYADGLIERAADVILKENKLLVISPRETPFSPIHLENMLKLSRIGVRIVPPIIGFYHKPSSVKDIIDFIVGRILDQLGIENTLYKRWKENNNQSKNSKLML